jgi:hypothetical protein
MIIDQVSSPAIANQWGNSQCMATIQATMNNPPPILHDSALAWAKAYYQTDQVVALILEEGDEPDRYLALIAAANETGWQAAEV